MSTNKQEMERAQLVGNEFVRLYFRVMNTYPQYLYLFYEEDSSVVVSEMQDDDKPLSIKASTRENVQKLLWWMYGEASVSLLASVPQISLNGSLLLLNSGKIRKKSCYEEKFFTQALFLVRQDNGYYVKTDTIQVLSHKTSLAYKLLPMPDQSEGNKVKKPLQLAGKARGTKHQPKDSCFDCHVELSQLDGNTTPFSSGTPLVSETPKHKHGKDTSVNVSLPDITEVVVNPIAAHNTCRGGAEADVDSAMHPLVVDDDTRTTKADKTQSVSAPTSFNPLGYLESATSAKHPQPPFTTENITENTGMPELTSLFAARLPMDITPVAVGALFSAYGKLKQNAPIRVFTGPTNCYACVSFESEADMRAALNSDIKYGGNDIVTEIWRPRDRRGRRTGREFGSRTDAFRALYRHP